MKQKNSKQLSSSVSDSVVDNTIDGQSCSSSNSQRCADTPNGVDHHYHQSVTNSMVNGLYTFPNCYMKPKKSMLKSKNMSIKGDDRPVMSVWFAEPIDQIKWFIKEEKDIQYSYHSMVLRSDKTRKDKQQLINEINSNSINGMNEFSHKMTDQLSSSSSSSTTTGHPMSQYSCRRLRRRYKKQ
ncbi:uncharacterized protein LOC128962564 [Oppia nitens]|uniref:uncharacterized protein LOC128962564 n=1 Tax=Oppia nitens TaxID=1686743 RepID=UPI0023D97F68|nr:uncharacterized protein LOC128962564 [Oppia nitens]